MFGTPQFIQSSFNIIFSPVPDIRRRAFELEKRLQRDYGQAQIISIPDEFDPQAPRIIFESKRLHSQLVISQISITFNAIFTTDYQVDETERVKYLNGKVPSTFRLLKELGTLPLYCGFSTLIHIPSSNKDSDEESLEYLASTFLKKKRPDNVYDIQFKLTNILENDFFSNIVVDNYRSWSMEDLAPGITQLSDNGVVERGIRIVVDVNNRYAFNESRDTHTSETLMKNIINIAHQQAKDVFPKNQEDENVLQ